MTTPLRRNTPLHAGPSSQTSRRPPNRVHGSRPFPEARVDAAPEARQGGAVATEEDVRRLSMALPGVAERLSWGKPAWFARTLMARMWEDGVVTVKTDERDVLAGAEPDTFYWTPHHDRSPNLVLVRLDLVSDDVLEELLRDSYRLASGG